MLLTTRVKRAASKADGNSVIQRAIQNTGHFDAIDPDIPICMFLTCMLLERAVELAQTGVLCFVL